MKTHLLVLVLCACSIQVFYSQEDDGVVSLSLPIRNSLTFNRFTINPTFSFVREQTKYISIFNKREWVQFEDAPLTYLVSYSGRFGVNIGAGLGLFQQNYGVLTTFGGVLNFAYNIRLARDSNLTFGLNVGAYKSGLNTANVVTNFEDPSLQNIPENFLLTINPGINYGLAFLDFGVSINNLVAYNFKSSKLIEDNPQQSIQAHIMHTGYLNSSGFFDESKFSGLIKSEFQKDETIISAIAMFTVPKGIWAQVGYNTLYGASGGIGLNITQQIAFEYNYEKAISDLSKFGSSHEITLAYRFNNSKNYQYSSGDEVSGLISSNKRKQSTVSKTSKEKAAANRKLSEKRKEEAQAKLLAEEKSNEEAKIQAKLLADQKAKEASEAKLVADQRAKKEAEAQAKLLAEQKTKEVAEAQANQLAEQEAKKLADTQAKLLAEQKAKEVAQVKANENLISNPKDDIGKAMRNLTQQTENSKATQNQLLKRFNEIIDIKNKDLKDLKKENDLSDQGIVVKPKPFKSVTAENNTLLAVKSELDDVIKKRNIKIEELKRLYDDKFEANTITNDVVFLYYKKTLKRLESEQLKAIKTRTQLEARLENIRTATEFERRRRIKRAAFDNEEERYLQDRATLQNIIKTTSLSSVPLKLEDFDFGEEQSSNIQILKNVKNVEKGYYVIIAVHSDVDKRNDFVTKVVASGRRDVDFFYDVNTSKYYIYYNKFDRINDAKKALESNEDKPYNIKMSLIKIEN
jgi:type IX secretion system PorP/SprF family membrane protein